MRGTGLDPAASLRYAAAQRSRWTLSNFERAEVTIYPIFL
jgi:hypothetical protein